MTRRVMSEEAWLAHQKMYGRDPNAKPRALVRVDEISSNAIAKQGELIAKERWGRAQCATCRVEIVRRNAVQKYCDACAASRAKARQAKWRDENPEYRAPPITPEKKSERAALVQANGVALSLRERVTVSDFPAAPDLAWYVRFKIPFTYAVSKNARYRAALDMRIFMRKEAKAVRDEIIYRLREVREREKVKTNKVWIDIFVEKPDHRGDAVNAVDLVCDAVKVALELDDRWFCLRSVDWRVSKSEPMLYVGVGQEECEDSQVCSSCGRILPLPEFTLQRANKNGRNRNCRGCMSKERAA